MGRLIDEDSIKFTDFEIVMCEGSFKTAFKLLCEKLDDAPRVDAEPIRHGYWEKLYNKNYKCSACGAWYKVDEEKEILDFNYCPRCGAKMDEDDWEEPEINPCRGCEDYDGRGGCKSNGGCGAEIDEVKDE